MLIELKAVEILDPSSKAQLFSYIKLLDIPIGLPINFHEPVLKNSISRMILPGANQPEECGSRVEISLQHRHLTLFVFFACSRRPSELPSVKTLAAAGQENQQKETKVTKGGF
ncbi:MAG: GxxExxY protein [Candidatus Udaeobacter sp.]